jgi:hypothetical protein
LRDLLHLTAVSILLSTIGLVLLLTVHVAQGEEDRVSFNSTPGGDGTDTTFVGEYQFSMEIWFGQNATDWEVALENPLLDTRVYGMTPETIQKGTRYGFSLDLNRTASPGDYNLTVFLNYTGDGGEPVHETFHFLIHHIMAIEVKRVSIAPGSPDMLRVDVTLFHACSELEVELRSGDAIRLSRETFESADVAPGNYSFSAEMRAGTWFSPRDETWVGYRVRAHLGGRYVEYHEVHIDPGSIRAGGGEGTRIPLIAVSVSIMACTATAIFIVQRRSRRRRRTQSTQAPVGSRRSQE